MKVPISWLKDFVDVRESPPKLAEILTNHGFEVGGISYLGSPLEKGDAVLEIDVLPNRPDCLSIRGIAREVATITGRKLKVPDRKPKESDESIRSLASVTIKDYDLCSRYMARVVVDVAVAPSPDWMQQRLLSVGLRPINNIVDITNYVLFEMGQPLHAFDLDRLAEPKVIVRRSVPGEKIRTLDGEERELPADSLCIADPKGPIALAGVMGGATSEISNTTRRVLIESALFSPTAINKTSKQLWIRTESSIRFEAGVAWDTVSAGLDLAAVLMQKLAGGIVARGVIDVFKKKRPKVHSVSLPHSMIDQVLGGDVQKPETKRILGSLGFDVAQRGKNWNVRVPSFRSIDIHEDVDLIEELARVRGYDKIGSSCRTFPGEPRAPSALFEIKRAIREILVGAGFREAITYSMVDPKWLDFILLLASDPRRDALSLRNPLRPELSVMRTILFPSLLESARYNLYRQEYPVALFEMGKIFTKKDSGVEERDVCAGVVAGEEKFFKIKGVLEATRQSVDRFNEDISHFPFLHPGESARTTTGFMGRLHPKVIENFELKEPVYIFEFGISATNGVQGKVPRYQSLPQYPAAFRDLSMIVGDGLSFDSIVEAIDAQGGDTIDQVKLIDRYVGPQIPPGHVSLTLRLSFRHPDRTLRDDEVEQIHQKIQDDLVKKLGVVVRK